MFALPFTSSEGIVLHSGTSYSVMFAAILYGVPKFRSSMDKQVLANSADSYQTAPRRAV